MGQAGIGCCGQKMQIQRSEETLLPTFRELCSLVSDPSLGSGRSQNAQEVVGQHAVPTSSPPSAHTLSFPRLEAVRFRWECPQPEVPGSPQHRAALAASEPSPGVCCLSWGPGGERPQDERLTL